MLDFLDLDDDGTQDSDEPSEVWSTTGLNGVAALTIPVEFDRNGDGQIDTTEGRLVLVGGIDSSTNLALGFALTAPIGSAAITPLTTLMTSLVDDQGLSADDAAARLVEAFGISDGIELRTFDPIAGVLSGDFTQSTAFLAGVRVQDVVTQISRLIAGAPGGPSIARAAELTFADLTGRLAAPGSTFDLGEVNLLADLINSVAARASVTLDPEVLAGAAQVIAETDARIVAVPLTGDLAYLRAVAQAQIIAQGSSADALADAAAGTTTIADVILANTGANLDASISAAVAGNVVPAAVYIDDVLVTEGADGTDRLVTFTVRLNTASTTPVSLDWETLDGTASADGDYTAATGHLSWAAGDDTPRTIQILVHGDASSEGDEVFQVLLGNIDGAVAWRDFGTATIADDDGMSYTAPADDGPNELRLVINGQELELTRNGALVQQWTLASPAPITILGADGVPNALTIEVIGENTALLGGLIFHGSDATDTLTVVGGPSRLVTLTPGVAGAGTVTIDGAVVTFTSAELVDAGLAASFPVPPSDATEGELVSLPAPAAMDGVIFTWTVTRDGADVPIAVDGTGALLFTPSDNGEYAVTLNATDSSGAIGRTIQTMTVANVAPTATLDTPTAALPGQSFEVRLTADDVDADLVAGLVYSFDLDGDGLFDGPNDIVDSSSPVVTASFASEGTYTIHGRVADKDGDSLTLSATIVVARPITVGAAVSGTAVSGFDAGPPALATFTDPNALSAPTTYTATIDWGDGSPLEPGTVQVIDTTITVFGTHSYHVLGTQHPIVRLTPLGGSTYTSTATIEVAAVGLIADPDRPAFTRLLVGGTAGDDKIYLNAGATAGSIAVKLNGVIVGTFTPTGSLAVRGGDGNDYITVMAGTALSAMLEGGSGNDVLTGGGGDDLLIGGDGNDTLKGANGNDRLFGEAGNDLISGDNGDDVISGGDGADTMLGGAGMDLVIGGDGADALSGNASEDILIAASTSYDTPTSANLAALDAILGFWTGAGLPIALRAGKIRDGAFGDGTIRLGLGTLFDDGVIDTLTGGTDADEWFIGAFTGDAAKRDKVVNRGAFEAQFAIDLRPLDDND
jgi:hypothetical protein